MISLKESIQHISMPTSAPSTELRTRSCPTNFEWMVVVENVIQALVVILILFGWYLSTFHIGCFMLEACSSSNFMYPYLYLICVNISIPAVAGFYLYLCSGRQSRNVALYPIPDQATLTEPYPCSNMAGNLEVCIKGECNGKWKPPRAHHCSTCGVCRLDFDHHCPWIGNCVTLSNLKAFMLLLCLIPLTFLISVIPVIKILSGQVLLALKISKQDEWVNRVWWSWWGSWVFCAGPLGRWMVGAIFGYLVMKNSGQRDFRYPTGHLIEEPHLRVILTAGVAFLLSVFAFALLITHTKKILQGVTTYETLRSPTTRGLNSNPYLVCFPRAMTDERLVVLVLPTERMYDLGLYSNWRSFMMKLIIPRSTTSPYVWPKLNPTMIKRMRSLEHRNQQLLI